MNIVILSALLITVLKILEVVTEYIEMWKRLRDKEMEDSIDIGSR